MEKSFSVGRALWAISRHKRIKFIQIAIKTGLSEGSVIRMAASHKLTSSPERIRKLAEALGVSLEEFLRAAREEFYGNFFITKARMPSEKETREYARQGLFLQRQAVLKYPDSDSPDFRVVCYTPPVESLVDFFAATVLISPGRRLQNCQLPRPAEIYLAVVNGAVQIEAESGEKIKELVAGQAASFNGGVKHSILNLSGEREAEIMISLKPTQILASNTAPYVPRILNEDLNIPSLIEEIRRYLSPDPDNPIPLTDLALRAGLSSRELGKLSKGEFINLPIEKMERLGQLLEVPLENLLKGTPFNSGLDAHVSKGTERGTCDYRTRFGVTFYPWVRLGVERRELFMGQAALEPQRFHEEAGTAPGRPLPIKEKIWEGKNWGYLLAKGVSGKLGVQAGERHNYPDIDREDAVYMDMSFGFSFRNFSPAEATNLFLVSSPPLF